MDPGLFARRSRRRVPYGYEKTRWPPIGFSYREMPVAESYFRLSLASIHSVACGTFIRRSLGMSFPVVLQMP